MCVHVCVNKYTDACSHEYTACGDRETGWNVRYSSGAIPFASSQGLRVCSWPFRVDPLPGVPLSSAVSTTPVQDYRHVPPQQAFLHGFREKWCVCHNNAVLHGHEESAYAAL